MPLISNLRRLGKRCLDQLDELFAGRWYWQARRWKLELQLDRELQRHGDVSMEVRVTTERIRRTQFAVEYWRAAPGPVMRVAREATARGVPLDDIRLMILNRDLRLHGDRAEIRKSRLIQWTMKILSAAFDLILVTHFLLMCALTVLVHGPIWLKVVVLCAVTLIYSVLYRGWALYTSRARGALSRSGDLVAAISEETPSTHKARTILE